MDIVMGLLAALCWGVTDYLVGTSARIFGVRQSVLLGQLIGLLVLTSMLAVSSEGFGFLFETDLIDLFFGFAAGLSTVAGAIALSSAFFRAEPQLWRRWLLHMVCSLRCWHGGVESRSR